MQAERATIFKLPDADNAEFLDLPIDALGDETDSDDGDNGDFTEIGQPTGAFQRVAGGRTTNSSRSASLSSG